MKSDRSVLILPSLTIHYKPVILAILICEKYLMSYCLFFVGNNLFDHSTSVRKLFWRCLDVCNAYLFLVKSRGAEEPNKTFANINKFNLYPSACLVLSDVFDYTKAHETVMALVKAVCSLVLFI